MSISKPHNTAYREKGPAYHQAVCANLERTKKEIDRAAIIRFDKNVKRLKRFSKNVGGLFALDVEIPPLAKYLTSPELFRPGVSS